MKFLLSVLSTAMLAYAAGIFLPWWGIAIAGIISGVWLLQKPGIAFLSGFLAVFLLWAGFALVRSQMNDDILATRFAKLILKSDQPLLLVLMTGVIGGLVAGLGALSGSLGRTAFRKKEDRSDEIIHIPDTSSTEQAG